MAYEPVQNTKDTEARRFRTAMKDLHTWIAQLERDATEPGTDWNSVSVHLQSLAGVVANAAIHAGALAALDDLQHSQR